MFKFGSSETLFSELVMRYVSEKSTSNHESGKQLQVTIIKITESKENKSIHRLDLLGLTGPERGAAAHLAAPASYGSVFNNQCSSVSISYWKKQLVIFLR